MQTSVHRSKWLSLGFTLHFAFRQSKATDPSLNRSWSEKPTIESVYYWNHWQKRNWCIKQNMCKYSRVYWQNNHIMKERSNFLISIIFVVVFLCVVYVRVNVYFLCVFWIYYIMIIIKMTLYTESKNRKKQ